MDQTKLWDTENIQTFVSNFNTDDIISLCMHLDYVKSQSSASQEDINQCVCFLNDIYNNCHSSFGTVSPGTTSSTPNSWSPWFNNHCKLARGKFHNAQHLYNLRKNHENRRNLNRCSKAYTKTLHQEQVKYKNSKIKELLKLKKDEPRKFWKFLYGNKRPKINLELDKAYEHFSKVNYNQEANTSEINLDSDLTENEELNGLITLEEIRKAVRTLKIINLRALTWFLTNT